MAKVFLGVGHGGSDPGAQGGGLDEADINLGIAVACQAELVRHGVQVCMSRTRDEDDPLTEEIRECNVYNPDLAVDIHTNAGGGVGFEAFHTLGGGRGKVLAQNIEAEVKAICQTSRGCKTKANSAGRDYFGFIRETKCPAVICECAFIDTAADRAKVDTADKQAVFGKAYARGILKTLGITVQPEQEIDPEVQAAIETIQTKAGLEEQTIRYLLDYQYSEALVKKLAQAINTHAGAGYVGSDWGRVQHASGLETQTMQYLQAYPYANVLCWKLAAAMT